MPIHTKKERAKRNLSREISKEIRAGFPQKQAIAIAFSKSGKGKKKKK